MAALGAVKMTSISERWRHGPLRPLRERGGVRFRLWAPAHREVSLGLESCDKALPMSPTADGWFEIFAPRCEPGERYRFVLSDGRRIADPASRFQPDDVHGPSEVVDPSCYAWVHDRGSRPRDEIVLYELHVGAFTKEGTFAAAAQKTKDLAALGVTAIEIMPIGDFPNRWNWGYDGVFPFAPDGYGAPDDFKALVDTAHGHGVSILLDVVQSLRPRKMRNTGSPSSTSTG
jgi:1,4-alpha-glucan branching enzyme